jgi:DNA replication protein DnaC
MRKSNPSNREPIEAVRWLLVEFNLTTIAQELEDLLRRAQDEAPSYSAFLHQVLEREHAARSERRLRRWVKRSGLKAFVDLEDFDFTARPQLSPQAVKELLGCRFVEEKRNVILVGRSSLGKTTVARAIGHAALRLGLSVWLRPLAEVLETLHAARLDGTYARVLRRLSQIDLLVLDDAGLSSPLGRDHASELFRLVSARHHQASTIVITNLPFKQWGEFLPVAGQTVAIVDRLIDDATILRFTGRPFRQPREILGAPLEDE